MKNYNPKILLIYNQEREAIDIDNYLKKFNYGNVVGTNNVLTAVKFCEINNVDIILSNLEMNNYCVVKRLLAKRVLSGIPLVFYSFDEEDFRKYSQSKELSNNGHVKVLLNPTQSADLNNSIVKLYQLKIANKIGNFLFAKSKENSVEKINFSDIKYIQSDVAHCKIFTKWGVYKTSENLAKLLKKLNKNFFKVHEKYVVNISHISNFNSKEVFIGGVSLPSSFTNQMIVKENLQMIKGDKELDSATRKSHIQLSSSLLEVLVS